MLGLVYRNLSEEQPSVGSALQRETRAVASAGFSLINLQCRLHERRVTSTPVCSAAV